MREKILFDENWMFHDGDIILPPHKDKGPIYKQAKTERKLSGTGSDITDHNPVQLTERKMYAGRITVAVQVGKMPGELKVYARSGGLDTAVLRLTLS